MSRCHDAAAGGPYFIPQMPFVAPHLYSAARIVGLRNTITEPTGIDNQSSSDGVMTLYESSCYRNLSRYCARALVHVCTEVVSQDRLQSAVCVERLLQA